MEEIERLVLGVNRRSESSFELLFNLYYRELVYFSTSLQGSTSDAEDIVHDVFIQFWESSYTFKEIKPLRAFLYTMVRNRTLNFIKRSRKSINDIAALEKELGESNEVIKAIVDSELLSILYKAVDQLPTRCGEIVKLALKGYSSAEISLLLNLAPSTIRAQRRIAISKLKELLPTELFSLFITFL